MVMGSEKFKLKVNRGMGTPQQRMDTEKKKYITHVDATMLPTLKRWQTESLELSRYVE